MRARAILMVFAIPFLAPGCMAAAGEEMAEVESNLTSATSPVPGRGVTFAYGIKRASYAAGYHTGEDYAAPTGTNVVAVRSGTIQWSNAAGGAYGQWIGLDADNGRTYVYCHLSSRLVTPGTQVAAGQVIGKVGATGNVTGPHLHFEDHPQGKFVYARGRKPSWSGGGATTPAPNATTCVPNSTYCGGPQSKVKGDESSLYRCDPDGAGATKIEACANGCGVNSGANDACN